MVYAVMLSEAKHLGAVAKDQRYSSARIRSIIPGDRLCRLLLLAAPLLVLALVRPMPALAGTFAVTRFDDPPPDGCATNGCSLREAVIAANSNPGTRRLVMLT
jgi:CSLREA domain-containing protein